ncbi:SMP-30/gluconolactonase/LRE family protein [Bradyrhizobium sp. LHD-71]|uniref:SMP-30/gluconolactonase/LRE family protein n=1 Tax=Bradyrhizobium sp. LHD-71 TaxID=3072141 RepID=UPI00280EFF3F|nr:SMP-30/gluconolactonase/LRE family protein [Bradyrhizobium sp. LHD-71]MDQ8728257.1 SMP-30/gluconolactonase/LRE family protein [Bradyrhizobium sp. LHD-71]
MAHTPHQLDGATFIVHRDDFHAVLGPGPQRLVLTQTTAHEGPVYVASEHALYFTTVPEPGFKNVAIRRLQLQGEEFPFEAQALDTVRCPSNMANGMTLDRDGHLVICEQGTRETPGRISRMDLKARATETVVDQWRGLHFNSPNDVVVKSDRTVWFTDPNYGEVQGFKGVSEVGAYVYRHDPATGETAVVVDGFNKPNGLAFSPDEAVLYVTDTGANQAPGTYFAGLPHHVHAFDVRDGRRLHNERLFAVVSPGAPDGIKLDLQGRVYTSSATGVQVFTPEGDLLGEIVAPGVANFTFGGPDNDVLLILGDTQIWQIKLQVAGVRTS